MALNGGDIWV